jgi:hypothetical protein
VEKCIKEKTLIIFDFLYKVVQKNETREMLIPCGLMK